MLYNAEKLVSKNYVNVCYSYPYILRLRRDDINNNDKDNNNNNAETNFSPPNPLDSSRIYILYYRWVHWLMLLISVIYGLIGQITNHKLLPELSINENSIIFNYRKNVNNNNKKNGLDKKKKESTKSHRDKSICKYDLEERRWLEEEKGEIDSFKFVNNNIKDVELIKTWLLKTVYSSVVYLCVDMMIIFALNYMLQYKFLALPIASYPYKRNPPYFTDYISRMFPPFAFCHIERVNELSAERGEVLGCHLTLMELYEKLFSHFGYGS